jgi:transposase
MQYVGIDWAYRRAAWCAKQADGTISGERFVPADEDGLARLVIELGPEVRARLEMMSGAVWVRDRLAGAGWRVEVADARKVKNVAPLACKTDRVDARGWPSAAGASSYPRSGSRRSRSGRCASG